MLIGDNWSQQPTLKTHLTKQRMTAPLGTKNGENSLKNTIQSKIYTLHRLGCILLGRSVMFLRPFLIFSRMLKYQFLTQFFE